MRRKRDHGQVSGFGSLRMVLVFLTLVPSLALLVLFGLSSAQLGQDWQRLAEQDRFTSRTAALATDVTQQLQEERRVTGQVLADNAVTPDAMVAQRKRTDKAVKAFRDSTDGQLSSLLGTQLRDAVAKDRDGLLQIDGIRKSVDNGTISDAISFESYTGLIGYNLGYFEALGNADSGELAAAFKPLTDLMWDEEMLSREDAVLTYSWASDSFLDNDRSNFSQWIGTQSFLLDSEITPRVTDNERARIQGMEGTEAWNTKDVVETVLAGHYPARPSKLPRTSGEWREAMQTLQPQLVSLMRYRTAVVKGVTDQAVNDLQSRVQVYAAIALGTLMVVVVLSVLLTRSLRNRILALRDEAARLETELPDVMERLRRGEDVDVDKEVREVKHGRDELGRLGQALNLARHTAVETTVRETEQHRGFQRMLQRIARRTQLLIGLQLKKLDEMERGQEDPKILEGLFDLDHLTSRLRRYEENLVVLGGGQPQRRWRKPVRVVDVLRSALGEVQDYRRIRIEVGEGAWVEGRAVGPLVHILAELMENAAAFSRPPNPVETRATLVGRGLAVEIEDRGLGMEHEEYDRINRMMSEPPDLDVVARAEDARLGLYVVSRLATGLGLQVEFRPSVYGGTRVIVMVPAELVAEPPTEAAHTSTGAPQTVVPSGPGEPSGVASDGQDTAAGPAAVLTRTATVATGYPGAPEHGGAANHMTAAGAGGSGEAHDALNGVVTRPPQRRKHARAEVAEPQSVAHTEVAQPQSAAHTETAQPRPAAQDPTPPAARATPAEGTLETADDEPSTRRLHRLPSRSRGRALATLESKTTSAARRAGRRRDGSGNRRPAAEEQPADQVSAAPATSNDPPATSADPGFGPPGSLTPLPKRVRQANLADGLKEPKRPRRPADEPRDGAQTARSGAALGAFQRQSRLAQGPAHPQGEAPTGDVTPDTRPNHTEDAP